MGCHALLQPADLPHPGIKLFSALAGGFFTPSATCCSQIKTQWEREGRGSDLQSSREGRAECWRSICAVGWGGVGVGKQWGRGGDDDQASPVWRRLLSSRKPTSQLHRMKTKAGSRRQSCGAHEMGICTCIETAALLLILKNRTSIFKSQSISRNHSFLNITRQIPHFFLLLEFEGN